jgi:hypothetical protein
LFTLVFITGPTRLKIFVVQLAEIIDFLVAELARLKQSSLRKSLISANCYQPHKSYIN